MLKSPLILFILLQVMDFATTLTVLAMGGQENNPIVAHFMALGPVSGLFLSKLVITGLAVAGATLGKNRGLRVANIVFMGIVAWNVSIIARLAMA